MRKSHTKPKPATKPAPKPAVKRSRAVATRAAGAKPRKAVALTTPATIQEVVVPKVKVESLTKEALHSDQFTIVKCPKCHGPLLPKMARTGPAIVCPCSHPEEFALRDWRPFGIDVPRIEDIVDEKLKLRMLQAKGKEQFEKNTKKKGEENRREAG